MAASGPYQGLPILQSAAIHGHFNVHDGKILDHARSGPGIQLQERPQWELHARLPLDALVDMAEDLQHLRTMRFWSTAKVPAKCKLKYYRISSTCGAHEVAQACRLLYNDVACSPAS